jgi:hypothetical protein
MAYMMIALLSTLFVYKIVSIGPTIITAGALLSPLWYFTADIITEVYGYNITRKVIWSELFLEFIFVSLGFFFIMLPSPEYWSLDSAYKSIFSNLPRVMVGSIVGTLAGSFINSYLISKWKILLKGKSFWLRSLGANAIGQLFLSASTSIIDLGGAIPLTEIVKEIFTAFPLKLASLSLLIIPTAIITEVLKRVEKYDKYDTDIDYNPFLVFKPSPNISSQSNNEQINITN